jgi:pyridoxal phosphate enzyme (YggS family)
MTNIEQNIAAVRARIQQSCHKACRSADEVTLLAVSKTVSIDAIRVAIASGQREFGENYVVEGVEKIEALAAERVKFDLQWHCIGPIQSNKTRLVAQHFDWVHTLDRIKIAERLSEQRSAMAAPLQVCIQVNIDGSSSKSGVLPDDVVPLALSISQLPHLQLRGIMAIPDALPYGDQFAINNIAVEAIYAPARKVFNQLKALYNTVDTLSIGMSADLEPAIMAGSTMVRVGSAIFGSRT